MCSNDTHLRTARRKAALKTKREEKICQLALSIRSPRLVPANFEIKIFEVHAAHAMRKARHIDHSGTRRGEKSVEQ